MEIAQSSQQCGLGPSAGTGYGCYDDMEGQPKNLSFDNLSIRRAFIRKVYLILMGQLVVTFGAIACFVFCPKANEFIVNNPWIFWVSVLVMLVTMLSLVCCEKLRRQTPANFIFLGLFTIAEAFILSVSASRFAPEQVLIAVAVTAAICLALTLFAMQTKYDFTTMGGILVAGLVSLIMFGLLTIFLKSSIITLIYSVLAALLFAIYLIFDTQLMIGGEHKYAISPEEYIFATLNLYLDIINIFITILDILGISQQ